MNKPYLSFLICEHGTHADVYINGLPIGVLGIPKSKIEEEFVPTDIGNGRDVVEARIQGSQFKNKKQLKQRLLDIIEAAIPDDSKSYPDLMV